MIVRITIPGREQKLIDAWNRYSAVMGGQGINVYPDDTLNLTITVGELSVGINHQSLVNCLNEFIDSHVDITIDFVTILHKWVVFRHIESVMRRTLRKANASSRVSKPYLPSPIPQERGAILHQVSLRHEDATGESDRPDGSRV